MTEQRPDLLVLGLGNLLLSDDGFGLELLAQLKRSHVGDARIEFLDGGTLGNALLGEIVDRKALLILDAISGETPGEVLRVDDPLARPSAQGIGGHGANASGLLAAALLIGELPSCVVIVGATPSTLKTGIGLSEPLRDALPSALALAEEVLLELLGKTEQGSPCTS